MEQDSNETCKVASVGIQQHRSVGSIGQGLESNCKTVRWELQVYSSIKISNK